MLIVEKPASHTYDDGNGSRVMWAVSANSWYSTLTWIQKSTREIMVPTFIEKPSTTAYISNVCSKVTEKSTFDVTNGLGIHPVPFRGNASVGK